MLLVNCWFFLIVRADQTNSPIAYAETKPVDGYFIGVTDEFGKTNTLSHQRLCFAVLTETHNNAPVFFPGQPEYAYQVQLIDSNGIAVPKTDLGKKAGSKFMEFNTAALHKTEIRTQGAMALKKTEGPGLFLIFRPEDLFQIEKSGNYTLSIRFQIIVFPQIGPHRQDRTNLLIRFPALKYSITKS